MASVGPVAGPAEAFFLAYLPLHLWATSEHLEPYETLLGTTEGIFSNWG